MYKVTTQHKDKVIIFSPCRKKRVTCVCPCEQVALQLSGSVELILL